ncbi:DNA polymerase I [Chromobacterium violaceum]|uniref:DNA polymerase I n=1 Tax=Chromobacterium violaceum TaxID=536 RepID=UPI0009B9746D|nr:DNA polymerase I [Chromobacterium violaceum]MBX9266365.1 DNA polymerase I [Chromobacterium violaceum]OQS47289.1 DNA polymerase I [Chromobacterium violaceum]OQS50366.1 DNA polymerase I [Chromobacterium violaceum]QRO32393.1 DNA polymerase I [Chromobacterium violaceum]QRQ17806.1 DNA polymerase I [Chromobacterium violaceum]
MKTLLLIDGSSYLYRAFHAMPDLRSPDGRPVGAVYGMVNMLRRLEKEVEFDYSACVFDAKGKTFRDDLYPEYKANRPSMPEELASQITAVHDVVQASGWPMLVVPGVEADDVIGTLARLGAAAGMKVIVSTGDKDMAQLVTPDVTLVNTMTNELLDEAGVKEKFGVPPSLIIDYLTLIGDKVDNVPGVDKCGPKTAVKWLEEYGSLDAIIAQAGSVGGKVGENLRAALDWLPMGRRLITIDCDVDLAADLPHGLPGLQHGQKDKPRLAELFQDLGFRTFYREVTEGAEMPAVAQRGEDAPRGGEAQGDMFAEPAAPAAPPAPSAGALARHYETILTEAQLDAWLAKLMAAKAVSFDTETTSLDPMQARIVGVSFSVEAGHAAYLPLEHHYAGAPQQLPLEAALAKLKPWLEDASKKKCGQNLKYDCHVLANHGIALAGIADDSMLASYVLESHQRHNMDDLARRHLGENTVSYEEICGKGAKQIGFGEVDVDIAANYAAEDADITLRLNQFFAGQLFGDLEKVYRDIELPVAEVLFKMERHGVLIDRDKLAAQSHQLGSQMLELEQRAYELAGQPFNLNSPKQLQEILFGKLAIPTKGVKKTPSGGYSTDESVLEQLALDHPLPKCILEYRGLAKLKSTYTDKLPTLIYPQTGRVHTTYAQAVAITGRLASNDPNLQNIPVRTAEGRRVREAFIAPAGWQIVSADYSQIELRIMAHLSDDEGMLKAFASGEDIHRATAAEVFGVELAAVTSDQRRAAKAINFGLIYGMSAFGLAAQLDIERSAAQQYIDRYFMRYPGVAEYMQTTREKAREQGYVETVFGRRLYLPDIKLSNPGRRAGAERAAINAPMQGTAADLIKLAMIAVQDWLERDGLQSKLIMQVHDELVLEVPQAELEQVKRRLPEIMAGAAELKVPLLAEVGAGDSWEAAH